MNRYLKVLFLIIIFSFAWGTWWGFYSMEKELPQSEKGPVVRVLSEEGFFRPSFIRFFHRRYEVQLKVTEKSSPVDLLRELLSGGSNYDLIQIPSFIGRSFLMDNVFAELSREDIVRLRDISVDFRALDYDPNERFLVPLTWGFNGFVVNTRQLSELKETLLGILDPSGTLEKKWRASLLPSPVELYSIAVKLRPAAKTWVETGNESELKKETRELKHVLKDFSFDPRKALDGGDLQAAQVPNGLVAKWITTQKDFRYVLPQEKSSLWVRALGISLGSKDKELAHRILNYMLDPVVNEELVKSNEQATTLTTIPEDRLPPLQRAQYVRMVPLSRVELLVATDALEPLWTRTIEEEILSRRGM